MHSAFLSIAGLSRRPRIGSMQSGGYVPPPPPAPGVARLTVSGSKLLKPDGSEIKLRGINEGTWGTMKASDPDLIATNGGNCIRLPLRWWGPYGGSTTDSRDDTATATALIKQSNITQVMQEIQWAVDRGLWIIFFIDSNCGQSGLQGGTGPTDEGPAYCDPTYQYGTSGNNFWTNLDARALFLNVWRYMATLLKDVPNIAMFELLPEPLNGTDVTYAGVVREFYLECMNAVREVDARTPFLIGPNDGYNMNFADEMFMTGRSDVVYTGNLLSASIVQPIATLRARLKNLLDLRTLRNVPLLVQQVGARVVNDPGHAYLMAALAELNANDVHWTYWQLRQNTANPDEYAVILEGGGSETIRTDLLDVISDAWLEGVAPTTPTIETTFNNLYSLGYVLPQPTAARTYTAQLVAPAKTGDLSTPGHTDNQTGAKVWRLTNKLTEGNSTLRLRHEYSRRSPWSRDNKRYIAQSTSGYWFAFDGDTHAILTRSGTNGSIPGMAGDCEPLWSPAVNEERVLYHTGNAGTGGKWYKRNVDTGVVTTFLDLSTFIPAEIAAGRLPSSFSDVSRAWFKGEGRPSNDYRYWCLRCENESETQRGILFLDAALMQATGYLETEDKPDHTTTSPLGNRMLVCYYDSRGVQSFARSYKGSNTAGGVKLTGGVVEHGDTGLGVNGEELYCQVDFQSGSTTEGRISFANCTTGERFANSLGVVYGATGESVSVHVSGIATEKRPGMFWISSYASYSNYGAIYPAPTARVVYETIFVLEAKANGKRHLVCETHQQTGGKDDDWLNGGNFFTEPHAAPNYDGTRAAYCSNFIGRSGTNATYPDSFAVYLPSTAY